MSILMADEMGKPKKQGMGEISKCAWLCDYYLENSEKVLTDKYVETEFYEKLCYLPANRFSSWYNAMEFSFLASF